MDEAKVLLKQAGEKLAEALAQQAFELWQRKDFRLYVEFAKLSKTEQDRIFNELEVTVIGLMTLLFDHAIDAEANQSQQLVYKMFRKSISDGFLRILENNGVENKYLQQWSQLIDMRLKEYRENYQISLKESKKSKELQDDEEIRIAWARIETMTIDCLTHIRRGKVEKDDPLWKLLRKWMIMIDNHFRPLVTQITSETN